jgi:hypothetical protein
VSNQSSCVRNTFFSTLCITLLVISALANPNRAEAQDCQAALESSTGAVELSNGDTANKKKGVDEWSGEVVKLVTTLPGVLVIAGDGDGAQDSVYTQGSSTSHPLIDSAQLGTGLGELQAVVPAGTHCIQVTPGVNATGDFEVFASFTDVCHLGDVDDHGNSLLCATPIEVGGSLPTSGEIGPASTADHDVFTFEQEAAATVTVTSTGGDVSAGLYDSEGTLLDTGLTFHILVASATSRYYVQVSGDDESTYEISVALDPEP